MKCSLADVHHELSHLLFAAQQEFKDYVVDIQLNYNRHTYLQLQIETSKKNTQLIVDRLLHGILNNGYNYRFKCICHSPDCGPGAWDSLITASVDLQNSNRN